MQAYLDPDQFPFTADEVRAAVEWLAEGADREALAGFILEVCARLRAEKERAALARARGSTDPEDINDIVLAFPEELYAALSLAGPDTALRVVTLLSGWRAQTVRSRRHLVMREHGCHQNAQPTAAVLAELEAFEGSIVAAWDSVRAKVAERRERLG